MSTASGESRDDHPVQAPGALLLCRARPESVGPAARVAARADAARRGGSQWSVLVPRGQALAARRGTRRPGARRLGRGARRRRPLARPRPVVGHRPQRLRPGLGFPPHRGLRMAGERHPGRRGRGDAHLRRTPRPRPGARHAVPGTVDAARSGGRRPRARERAARGPHARGAGASGRARARPLRGPAPRRGPDPAGRRADRVDRLACRRRRRTRRRGERRPRALAARPEGAHPRRGPAGRRAPAHRLGAYGAAAAAGSSPARS